MGTLLRLMIMSDSNGKHSKQDDVYAVVIVSKPLQEFTRFT